MRYAAGDEKVLLEFGLRRAQGPGKSHFITILS
jgi:nicotinic acid phosphoribosyltransferase